jgi:hypothetical protein
MGARGVKRTLRQLQADYPRRCRKEYRQPHEERSRYSGPSCTMKSAKDVGAGAESDVIRSRQKIGADQAPASRQPLNLLYSKAVHKPSINLVLIEGNGFDWKKVPRYNGSTAVPIGREGDGPGRSHSCSFDQRRRPETFRTAMATAFFCPTRTTSRLPRVTPV